jgi:hypothetical protein
MAAQLEPGFVKAIAGAVADDAVAPDFRVLAGKHCAQLSLATLKELPRTASGAYVGASVAAIVALCPTAFFGALVACDGGVFRAADGRATSPVPKADLVGAVLAFEDAVQKPLAALRLCSAAATLEGVVALELVLPT